ncbi:biotin/lipoyl-containing protein [Trinickia sp. YCB016]
MTQKPEVDLGELRQITSWLAARDIGFIEVSRAGTTVRLKLDTRRGGDDASLPLPTQRALDGRAGGAQPARADAVSVVADTVGTFVVTHPARQAPFVEVGARVVQGEVIGLLQIAQLYLPVVAPGAGVVKQRFVAHGETVGYGTPLFEISPAP